MVYEVDQSGRVEETNRATIIAIANKVNSFTVKISASEKRLVFSKIKSKETKVTKARIFALLLHVAIIKSRLNITRLIIDIEYPGYEDLIQNLACQRLDNNELVLEFKKIGKSSEAHFKAYGVFIGKRKPDLLLRGTDLLKEIEMKKAESRRTLRAVTRRHGYRDSQLTRHL